MKKQKKVKKAYKYLRDEEVQEFHALSTEKLLKEFLVQTKEIKKINKAKKEDNRLNEVKSKIKDHRETSPTPEILKELNDLKSRIKEIKEEIDEEIRDLLEEQKEINKDFKEDKGVAMEKTKLIQFILDKRD